MNECKEKKEKTLKPTRFEMNRRLDIVEKLLIKGLHVTEICAYLEEREKITVHRKTVERYITKVNKLFEKARAPRRQAETHKAIKRYELWMAKCDLTQDYRTAAKIQDSLCKLLGLYSPDQIEITAEVSQKPSLNLSRLTTDELREFKLLMEKAKPEEVKNE